MCLTSNLTGLGALGPQILYIAAENLDLASCSLAFYCLTDQLYAIQVHVTSVMYEVFLSPSTSRTFRGKEGIKGNTKFLRIL